ncbi:MAG: AIPR family protein [Xanthomonadales bacterium]|nr:AIPR family protein [Xanthomonadales bacterium]
MRYQFFINVLDGIIREAPARYGKKYPQPPANADQLNQARSRALIHLFLKVRFGLTAFEDRERTVTDGGYDGGVDAYHICRQTRKIYLLQSKFRTTEANFESKEITSDELIAMDVDRITGGFEQDELGNEYSGKIKQLQREISEIADIGRYDYVVVLLANLASSQRDRLSRLFGRHLIDVFPAERTYSELVFPVLSGTYFTASDLVIPIDLSSKNAGSKISYEVRTKYADCEITVLFVPAIEIARIMHLYKNAILKYNPRSYLEHEGQSVNNAIRQTVMDSDANELALYNNGITMLSEETNINERVGRRASAQLYVRNPQIINGGQTSFTLSRIYSDPEIDAEKVFGNKEIMLKVITVFDCSPDNKGRLIDEISTATNRQTPVIGADRFANDSFHLRVQKMIFDRYGVLYERKRGEFADGVRDGYITLRVVIERNSFWRVYYAANGDIDQAAQKRLFQKNNFKEKILQDPASFDRWAQGFRTYARIRSVLGSGMRFERSHYAMIFACVELSDRCLEPTDEAIDAILFSDGGFWDRFVSSIRERSIADPQLFPGLLRKGKFSVNRYFKMPQSLRDVKQAVRRERESGNHSNCDPIRPLQ